MATENLDSMIVRKTPTKSEIVSLGHSLSLNADKIMLSDETATSKNWYFIITGNMPKTFMRSERSA